MSVCNREIPPSCYDACRLSVLEHVTLWEYLDVTADPEAPLASGE